MLQYQSKLLKLSKINKYNINSYLQRQIESQAMFIQVECSDDDTLHSPYILLGVCSKINPIMALQGTRQ